MTHLNYFKKLDYLNWLIDHQSGNAQHLANKLEVSKRTVKRMLSDLRETGIEVYYNNILKRYKKHN